MFDPNTFFNIVNPNKNIIVAYSGGVDSTAMLHFCYELHQKKLLRPYFPVFVKYMEL